MKAKAALACLLFLLSIFLVPLFVSSPIVSALTCTATVSSGGSIQTAINSASSGAVICVGPGTFAEQLTITKPLTLEGSGGSTVIKPTSVIATSTDPEDGLSQAPIILVGSTTGVTISDLTVDGSALSWSKSGCVLESIGILYLDASGTISQTTVTNINLNSVALYGCQTGNAILVQSSSGKSSTVSITGNSVTNYQKNGITCNDAGTACTISGNTVSPLAAAQPFIASNGVQIAFGAVGSITGNTISGNECTLTNICNNDLFTQNQATGIITYQAGTGGVLISGNTLSANDIGIGQYYDTSGTINPTGNNVLSSKYVGILLYDESQTVSGNTISNSPNGTAVVSDTSGLTAKLIGTDSFSNVGIDCQPIMANGGVAICSVQSGQQVGVPEFGAPTIFIAAISLLLVVVLRKIRPASHGMQAGTTRAEL